MTPLAENVLFFDRVSHGQLNQLDYGWLQQLNNSPSSVPPVVAERLVGNYPELVGAEARRYIQSPDFSMAAQQCSAMEKNGTSAAEAFQTQQSLAVEQLAPDTLWARVVELVDEDGNPRMTTNPTPESILNEIVKAYDPQPDEVFEARILEYRNGNYRPVMQFGYFDFEHLRKMARELADIKKKAVGSYVTLNPVNPQLLPVSVTDYRPRPTAIPHRTRK